MNEKIKNLIDEEYYIPTRFGVCNAVLLACELGMLGSKNLWVKAGCALVSGIAAYQINNEMRKFMQVMLEGKVRKPWMMYEKR